MDGYAVGRLANSHGLAVAVALVQTLIVSVGLAIALVVAFVVTVVAAARAVELTQGFVAVLALLLRCLVLINFDIENTAVVALDRGLVTNVTLAATFLLLVDTTIGLGISSGNCCGVCICICCGVCICICVIAVRVCCVVAADRIVRRTDRCNQGYHHNCRRYSRTQRIFE